MRKISLVLILTVLPFLVLVLNNKFGPQRKIASESAPGQAVNIDNDISSLPPKEFKKAFKYEVLKNVKIEKDQHGTGLSFGSFFLLDNNGSRVPVCDQYPYMDQIFTADGIAFSGEVPQMVVRGPCVVSEDQKHIEALPIPFYEILNSSPQQYEFHSLLRGQNKVQIYFRNVVGFWPTEWSWSGVTFYHKDPQVKIKINGYEVISVLGTPLIINANE